MTPSEQARLESVERQLWDQKMARERAVGIALIVLMVAAWKRANS